MADSDTNDSVGTSEPPVTLHPLDAADLPAIATLYVAAVRDDELFAYLWPSLNSCLERFRTYSLARFKQQCHSPSTFMFVAKIDGNTVGYSAWTRIGARDGSAWVARRKAILSVCKFPLQLKLIIPTRRQARRVHVHKTLTLMQTSRRGYSKWRKCTAVPSASYVARRIRGN